MATLPDLGWLLLFDAADLGYSAPANGGSIVTAPTNHGSRGGTWTPTTAGGAPTYVADHTNGNPAVRFGAGARLTAGADAAVPAVVAVVASLGPTGTDNDVCDGSDNAGTGNRCLIDEGSGNFRAYNGSALVHSPENSDLHLFIFEVTTGTDTFLIDNSSVTGNAGNTGFGGMALGASQSNSFHQEAYVLWAGRFDGTITAQQATDLYDWYQERFLLGGGTGGGGDPAIVTGNSVRDVDTNTTVSVPAPVGLVATDRVAIVAFSVDDGNLSTSDLTMADSRFSRIDLVHDYYAAAYYGHFALFVSDEGEDVSGDSSWIVTAESPTVVLSSVSLRLENAGTLEGISAVATPGVTPVPLGPITTTEDGSLLVAVTFVDPGQSASLSGSWAVWGTLSAAAASIHTQTQVTAGSTPTDTVTPSGGSGFGPVVFAINPPPVTMVPGAPQSLVATPGDTDVALSWDVPTDDGGSTVTGYVVDYRNADGGTWTLFSTPSGLSETVTGLDNYDEYEFRIRATNSNGSGAASTTATATPTDGNDPDDTFNFTGNGDLSVLSVGWNAVGDVALGQLQHVNHHVESDYDPQGTACIWATAIGPNAFNEMDCLLGTTGYSEVIALFRLDSATDEGNDIGFIQWVSDGEYAAQGSIVGPSLQFWKDVGGSFTLWGEVSLPDNGERTLRFEAQGKTFRVKEGGTTLLEETDSTLKVDGDYVGIGLTAIAGAVTSGRIDNYRVGALAATAPKLYVGDQIPSALYIGGTPVDAAYVGAAQVWP